MTNSFFVLDEFSGTEHGPYNLTQIRAQIYNKKLKRTVLVRRADSKDFFKAGDMLGKVYEAVEKQKLEEKGKARQAKESQKAEKALEAKRHRENLANAAKEKADKRKSNPENNPFDYGPASEKVPNKFSSQALPLMLLIIGMGTAGIGFLLLMGAAFNTDVSFRGVANLEKMNARLCATVAGAAVFLSGMAMFVSSLILSALATIALVPPRDKP